VRTLILDSGAFIASEKKRPFVAAYIASAEYHGDPVIAPAIVIAETWREPAAYALTFILASLDDVEPLDLPRAKVVGHLLGHSGTRQIADASVAEAASRHRPSLVLTNDAADISSLLRTLGCRVSENTSDPQADVVVVSV
jgi:predicted nucleic acid-binding protein